MSIKVQQAKNKSAVFNEIKKQYAVVRQATSTGADAPRYWREDWFTWQAPVQGWIDNLKTLGSVEVKLRYVGNTPSGTQQKGLFNVELHSESKAGASVSTNVGTIQEEFR